MPACTSSMPPSRVMTRAEQDHGEVGGVLPDPVVPQRDQLVAGRGQPHHPVAVHGAGAVDITPRQGERELGDKPVGRAFW